MIRKQDGKLVWVATSAAFAVIVLLAPATVFANHFELSRLANQLDLASSQLAYELRYNNAYSSVRSRARSLSREAGQLFDALQRNRSSSSVRSHFKDVRRRYDKLEEAYIRADRKYYDEFVYQQVDLINQLFNSLNSEYYYAYYSTPRSSLPYYNYGRAYSYSPFTSRSYSSRSRSSRSYAPRRSASARSAPRVVNRRGQQAIPQVFRGDRDRANGSRNRSERPRNRQTQVPRDNFDQSSPVLDRQNRQDRDRRQTANRVRNTQPSISAQNRGRTRQAPVADTPRRPENRVRNAQPANRAQDQRDARPTRQARVETAPRSVENRDNNRQSSRAENRRGSENRANRSRGGAVGDLRRQRIN